MINANLVAGLDNLRKENNAEEVRGFRAFQVNG